MKLRSKERCPIHGEYYCCGRVRPFRGNKALQHSSVSKRAHDGREICTPAEMRRRLAKLLRDQNGVCALCQQPITDVREATIDHIEPRGMGGARRDDSWGNIQAAHGLCNMQKGSKRS